MIRRAWLVAAAFLALAAPARADNRIIIRTTLGLQGLQQALQPLCLLQTCTVVNGLGDPSNQLFLVTTSLDPSTLLGLVRALPGVIGAELDQLVSMIGGLNVATGPPSALSDSTPINYYNPTVTVWHGYVNQPAAVKVRVATAQTQFSVAGRGIVADIDTGIDPNHPAFAGVLAPGAYDFTRNQQGASEINDLSPTDFPTPHPACTPSTCTTPFTVNQSSVAILDQSSVAILDTKPQYAAFGHGTMVMGVIHLVAPTAKLLPLKAFSSDGTGYLSDILRAIYYAVGQGANVINMSFDISLNSPELASALNYANQSALICVASAGNDGQKADPSTGSGMVYPAALQNLVMGVASTSDADTRSTFSNYGNAIVWVAAPGEGIVTTYPFSTYAAGWGTSFSAPFVSGGSALFINKQSGVNESQAANATANAVSVGADMGHGRLDLVQALQGLSPQDFTLSVSPSSSTINSGQSASYTLALTPSGGFNQTITLSCGGFPRASTCVVTPPAVTLDGTHSATASVVIQTTARSAAPPAIPPRVPPIAPVVVGLAYLLAWVTWLFYFAARRFGQPPFRRPGLAAAVGLLAILLYCYSCGGAAAPGPNSSLQTAPTSFSLTLNPTSVNGGNASTGALVLSSPAPGGGMVFALSSSNTSVATVPASVTIAAGSTAAAFQVATKTTGSSTAVTISASSSGVTQTAALTVTPAPPPGTRSLTSLSFNPNPVTGGSSSTGAVTLSGPAPSGGALVSLSSSNSAVVPVPPSVTIPAGATGASFTANTSIVTTSTAVTISASYAGVTQTSVLTVTPLVSTGTPAGTSTVTTTGTSGNLRHTAPANLTVN
jgi:subtilase family protein